MSVKILAEKVYCAHCGDECRNAIVDWKDQKFCCEGCKLVYEVLSENNLTSYYALNKTPGTAQRKKRYDEQFAFLDQEAQKQQLIQFTDGKTTRITFSVPQVHCSSCVWLLENLHRINNGIVFSQVNYSKKTVSLIYDEQMITLRKVVELLSVIGYEPALALDSTGGKKKPVKDYTSYYKIGIAGFCFGNIMMFSFPEYFSSDVYAETGFKGMFSYLNFALSLPVFVYCSSQFFKSALNSLKQKFLNIDVPIALGILVMFIRSTYDIVTATGPGFMDTMSGLVFFMLIGREFQNKTYAAISFDRDYKSFFPISIMIKKDDGETSVPVSSIRQGDIMIIRNEELIPTDSILQKGEATIDYSFVTGESMPVQVKAGTLIYAGGKQTGTAIEVKATKSVSQSYLTQLWNSDFYVDKKDGSRFQQVVNQISHYFTIVLIAIALASLGGWALRGDIGKGWNAFTAVLIIACPCALAISSPFTLGNILRIFGRKNFYLKNFSVIEKLAKVDTIVFDKTGTLTKPNSSELNFVGELNADEMVMVKSVAYHSSHALSKMLIKKMSGVTIAGVEAFSEISGRGIEGVVFGVQVKIGLPDYIGVAIPGAPDTTRIYVSINEIVRGYFSVANTYREGVKEIASRLSKSGYHLAVLSGDHSGEKENLEKLFSGKADLRFAQAPADKLRYIQHLQRTGKNVLMVGDGLNDAGALKQSDLGISITDDINNFSPACDGILHSSQVSLLPAILKTAKASRNIIIASFCIALLYNIIGLSYAISGNLSPVIAAILMPLSAITIITFTTGISNFTSRLLN